MRVFLLAHIFLLLVAQNLLAQKDVYGLKGARIGVTVDPVPPPLQRFGVFESSLKEKIEMLLQTHGVPFDNEVFDAQLRVYIAGDIQTREGGREAGLFIAVVQVAVLQWTYLERLDYSSPDDFTPVYAGTWEDTTWLSGPYSDCRDNLTAAVMDCLNAFINEYQKANPAKSK